MCVSNPFSSPSTPSPPPIAAVATTASRTSSDVIRRTRNTEQDRARALAARGGTLVTGPSGLTGAASTQKKTLLGA